MDDNQALYAKDTVTRLIERFQATFGNYFNSYWEDTPSTVPPATDFPLVIIQKLAGKAILGPTSTDDVNETVMITVMLNKADDVGSANVRTTTMRHLQNLIEGQDPVSLDYKADTLFFALRTFLTLMGSDGAAWLIDSEVSVKYDQVPRKDLPTIAIADITMTTQRRIIVPGRS